eukprot:TRINITY_DN22449_c0_g1_i1.p1 TRINITY_DN22449_c0_g1~~TRINITY_DN22449_c0_g1_i1.p1  ORF type:complete len:247 (-),score=65.45 TRINITY_DN22449_c0_g1_i1:201-941(-)
MILELTNTLALAYIATEQPQWSALHKQHPRLLAAVVTSNLLLSDKAAAVLSWISPDSPLAALHSGGRAVASSAAYPLEWLGATVGASGVIALLAVVLALAVLHAQRATYKWRVWAVLLGGAMLAALWLAEADEHVHHREPLKVLTLLVVFGAACLVDVRRRIPEMSVQQFLSNAQAAVLLVLPVCPCLSVMMSVGFLVIITVLEKLRIDPHFLNSTIYYGTMYGPFYFVYVETKYACIRQGNLLPS